MTSDQISITQIKDLADHRNGEYEPVQEEGKLNFKEWVEFTIPNYLIELKKKKKVAKVTKATDGPNPFFELGYISVKKLNELRALFD